MKHIIVFLFFVIGLAGCKKDETIAQPCYVGTFGAMGLLYKDVEATLTMNPNGTATYKHPTVPSLGIDFEITITLDYKMDGDSMTYNVTSHYVQGPNKPKTYHDESSGAWIVFGVSVPKAKIAFKCIQSELSFISRSSFSDNLTVPYKRK